MKPAIPSILFALLFMVGCRPSGPGGTAGNFSQLHELTNIDDLTSSFNRGKGVPRLVLLLSPT